MIDNMAASLTSRLGCTLQLKVNQSPENVTPTTFPWMGVSEGASFGASSNIPNGGPGGKGARASVVAEDNKEAKEGDGKRVNRIDEKGLHHDRDGCLWRNNGAVTRKHAFAPCAVHCHHRG